MHNRVKAAGLVILAALMVGQAAAGYQSIDRLTYQSEGSDFYNGPVFQALVTSNYETDTLTFELDNRDFTEKVAGETDNRMTLDITSQNTFAKYGFRDTGLPAVQKKDTTIFTIDITFFSSDDAKHEAVRTHQKVKNTCVDLDNNGIDRNDYYVTDSWGLNYQAKVFCVTQGEHLGNVGEIASDPKDIYETTWELSNGQGVVERKTISNEMMGEDKCVQIGPNTRACFEGGASTGKNAPVPTDELILHSNSVNQNNGFTVIQRQDYDSYRDAIPRMSTKIDKWAKSEIGIFSTPYQDSTVVSEVNQRAEETAAGISNSEFTDARFNDGGSIGQGSMEVPIDELFWPEFSVEMKACRGQDLSECDAFVNIKKSVGEPKITDVSGDTFSELSTGEIEVTYKNVGDAEGSFAARVASCQEGFEFTGVSDSATLDPGETTTASFPISFSSTSTTSGDLTKSCTVEVEETTTGQQLTERVQVTGEQKSECTYYEDKGYGQMFKKTQQIQVGGDTVEQDIIYECNKDELGTSIKKRCEPVKEEAVRKGEKLVCAAAGTGTKTDTGGGEGEDCSTTLLANPMGADLTAPNPVCQFKQAFGGIYGTFKLFGSFMLGAFFFGFRGAIGRIMSLEPTQTLSVLGRSVKARYILGIFLFLVGFYLGLNIMSNPIVKWGITIATVLIGGVKLYFQGPMGLISWIIPNNVRG